MSGFARAWLALRAPYDARARSRALASVFAATLPEKPRIVDLGAGAGANRSWLEPHLPRTARWTLVDDDAALLDGVADARRLDLARELASVGDADGVTCSAFLDLVSADWLDGFGRWLEGRPLLAALSVDGRVRFAPDDPEDEEVLSAFRLDQRRDKGFGPALGPEAPWYLTTRLRSAGYRVATVPSDWMLGPGDEAMLAAMIDGFAAVAANARAWAQRRHAHAKAGALRLLIGHVDLLASCGRRTLCDDSGGNADPSRVR